MAEGEVQQAINEIRDAASRLADVDVSSVVRELDAAANRLNDLLADGGTTSEQDTVPEEEPAEEPSSEAGEGEPFETTDAGQSDGTE